MYLAASVPPRAPGPRPSSRSSDKNLMCARKPLSSIFCAAASASLASLSSARFSDITLSKEVRGAAAADLLDFLPRLLLPALFFWEDDRRRRCITTEDDGSAVNAASVVQAIEAKASKGKAIRKQK